MISVPAFLLKRLYVKGSLRNAEDGFQFDLKNSLGSGYAHSMLPLTLDGEPIPLEATSFVTNGEAVGFAEVNKERPFTLKMNSGNTIQVKGIILTAGAHRVGMSFVAAGIGKLQFEFSDTIG